MNSQTVRLHFPLSSRTHPGDRATEITSSWAWVGPRSTLSLAYPPLQLHGCGRRITSRRTTVIQRLDIVPAMESAMDSLDLGAELSAFRPVKSATSRLPAVRRPIICKTLTWDSNCGSTQLRVHRSGVCIARAGLRSCACGTANSCGCPNGHTVASHCAPSQLRFLPAVWELSDYMLVPTLFSTKNPQEMPAEASCCVKGSMVAAKYQMPANSRHRTVQRARAYIAPSF